MLSGKTVLLVEDEPLIGIDMMMALEDAGACVSGPVRSVKSGMAQIEDRSPSALWDVAILDYNLLDGNADTLIAKLSELLVPIVMHTGNPSSIKAETLKCVGEVIVKPSRTSELLHAVQRSACLG
jgi:DNA-binding response OmpR family regulator